MQSRKYNERVRSRSVDNARMTGSPLSFLHSYTNPSSREGTPSPTKWYPSACAASYSSVFPEKSDILDAHFDPLVQRKPESHLAVIQEEKSNSGSQKGKSVYSQEEQSNSSLVEAADSESVRNQFKKISLFKASYRSAKVQADIGFDHIGSLNIQFRKVIMDLIENKRMSNEEKENIEISIENFFSELNVIFKSDMHTIVPLSVLMSINMRKFIEHRNEKITSKAVSDFIWATSIVSYEHLAKTFTQNANRNASDEYTLLNKMNNDHTQMYYNIPQVNEAISVVEYNEAYLALYNYKKGPERRLYREGLDVLSFNQVKSEGPSLESSSKKSSCTVS